MEAGAKNGEQRKPVEPPVVDTSITSHGCKLGIEILFSCSEPVHKASRHSAEVVLVKPSRS